MALKFVILTTFALLATVNASEITYSKADGNSYVGTGPDNYALTGSTLAEYNIKVVTVNDNLVTVITLDGLTRSTNLRSLSSGLRDIIEDLRKAGSSHNNDVMYSPNLIVDNVERQMFRAKMSQAVPNFSTITMGQYIKSIAVPDFADGLARVVVDDDVVSFINYDGSVSMKPIAFLSEPEEQMLEKHQVISTSTHISPWELEALKRRLIKLHDLQTSGQENRSDELSEQQWHEASTSSLSDEDKVTVKQEELSSKMKLMERKVQVALQLHYKLHETLEKEFQDLSREYSGWEREQAEKYEQFRSDLEKETEVKYNDINEDYGLLKSNLEEETVVKYNYMEDVFQSLKSRLVTQTATRYNYIEDDYNSLKSKLEALTDARYNYTNDHYHSLKSRLEAETDARHDYHTDQYQRLKSEIENESNAWFWHQNEKYDMLKANLENDFNIRIQNSHDRFEKFKSDLESDANIRHKLLVDQQQQLSSKIEELEGLIKKLSNGN